METDPIQSEGMEGHARWSLHLFGGFELSTLPSGEKVVLPGKRDRVLLAYLAVCPNFRGSRRKLATLLWGDATDETALDNLRTCVWSLRKGLSDTKHRIIASEGEDVVLDATAFEIDAVEFPRLAGGPGKDELEKAAKLYSGPFLDGLGIENEEFETWRREDAGRFKDRALDVLNRLMTLYADSGEVEPAIEVGLRVLRLEPLHEAAARRLMRLYAASSRRPAAIQLYRSLSEMLKTELDAQPEAETRAVYAEITSGGEEISAPPAVEAKRPSAPSIMAGSSRDMPHEPPMPQSLAPAPLSATGGAQNIAVREAASGRLRWIVVGALAATVAIGLVYQLANPAGTVTAQQSGVEAARTASSVTSGAISIAVLPFTNLSSDPEQEFFSDGMTEEITSALAKIADLRVVGRTSAFQFKGEKKDLRTVGQALGATHLIEGSVRKAGNRVRITVQLVKADSGLQVWTDNYDRDLTDVFAIQEDIATAIAGALRMPLGLKPGENLVSNRSIDPESYQQYLRAKPLVRMRGRGVPEAIKILEPLVARNPDYAPAWAWLANAYSLTPNFARNISIDEMRRVMANFLPKAAAAGRRAIQLDPNLADGYLALGRLDRQSGKLISAEEFYFKALALDPNNPDILNALSLMLAHVGRVKESLARAEQFRALEPFVNNFNRDLGEILWENGRNDDAIAMLKNFAAGVGDVPTNLARIYASMGRYGDAANVLLEIRNIPTEIVTEGARLLRMAPVKVTSPQSLPKLGSLGFIYLYIGASDRALEFYEETAEAGFYSGGDAAYLWNSSYAPVRKTGRFKAFVRKAGMVEYWRAKGWPEFCRPTTGDDFVCN